MQIEETIEVHVREAFGAVIGRDSRGLQTSLARLDTRDLQTAVSYAVYVCGYVVSDVFNGELRDEGLAEMARFAVEDNKEWADLGDSTAIASFLKAAAVGDVTFSGVPEEDVIGHSFVVGGYLLSRYRREGQRWFEYLDDVWNAATATES